MKLCLLVSRRCNLRCGFCRVDFIGRDMAWDTAKAAVDRYLDHWGPRDETPRVKFFGGEPMLNYAVIRRLVEHAREERPEAGVRFELPTNGSGLNAETLGYFRERPEVEVTVSQPVAGASALPGVFYTVVLDQRTTPSDALARMGELLRLGYRRFNFLPAYYAAWRPEELQNLRASFAVLGRLFEGLWARGEAAEIKNLRVWSPIPLYNDALTVDVDGTLYASNMVQCEGMEPFRERLRLATVADAPADAARLRVPGAELEGILREWTGPAAWESTRAADAALTEFVRSLSGGRHGPA